MKRNTFGEMRLQPGDDLFACWNDEFNPENLDFTLTASNLEQDPEFGWTCSLMDPEGNESEAQNFTSQAELRAWLGTYHMVIID